MKALILGAGFGTRLERDLKNEVTDHYKHLIGVPKPLLPIGHQPLVTHWMKSLETISDVDQVYIVVSMVDHCKLFVFPCKNCGPFEWATSVTNFNS